MRRNSWRLASLIGCLLARRCHGVATAPQIAALGAGVDVVDGRGGSLHALSGEEIEADLSAPLWLVDKASGGVAVLGASLNSEERRRVCEAVHARAPASRPARGPRARLPRGEAAEAGATADPAMQPERRDGRRAHRARRVGSRRVGESVGLWRAVRAVSLDEAAHASGAGDASSQCEGEEGEGEEEEGEEGEEEGERARAAASGSEHVQW